MRLSLALRIGLALIISLGLLLFLAALLFVTESALNVWDRLRESPRWFFHLYLAGLGTVFLVGGLGVWRLVRSPHNAGAAREPRPRPTAEVLEQRLAKAEDIGVDVAEARRELESLATRREAGRIHVALFGDISTGKTSLIRALIPGAEGAVDVVGGTTRQVVNYAWRSPAGDELMLADVPGLNETARVLDGVARDEALRAHVVIYVTDGDLTRTQNDELNALLALAKPIILALNKSDRYTEAELEQLRARIGERLSARGDIDVVTVNAGGQREIVRVHPDGREERVTQMLAPQVEDLRRALQRRIDTDPKALESLRDSAVFVLVERRVDAALAEHRRTQAEQLVTQYSRKAVLGALAAAAPGTDLLIQGYLGTALVRELCQLYDVPVRQFDTDRLLDLVRTHVGTHRTILLAVAGNTLKAFPGVGTVAGGLVHAVAYGFIFNALGRGLAKSLQSRGELQPVQAAAAFKDNLAEELESGTQRIAKLVLDELRRERAS